MATRLKTRHAEGDTETVAPFDPQEHMRWLHGVANMMRPYGDPMHDDIVQEGLLAMWRAHEEWKPEKASYLGYLHMVASRRMSDIASLRKSQSRLPELQNRGHREPKRDQLYTFEAILGLEPDSETPAEALLLDPTQPDVFDQVQASYHRGEILKALNELRPEVREYVVLRFWGGLETAFSPSLRALAAELAPQMTGRKGHLWREAQEELEFKLSHLQDSFGD